MRRLTSQIWLTSVLTDSNVRNALALCFSLRRVATTRKIAVIVSHRVSKQNREALEQTFDFVFILQEDRNSAHLKSNEFVKLFALTLKNFSQCVMLDPNMMVLKNCDQLFDWAEENDQHYAWTKKQDMSVLVIRPSLQEFNRLLTKLETNGGTEIKANVIATLLGSKTGRYIDDKYNRSLVAESEMLLGSEEDISIVKLPEEFKEEGLPTKSLGLVGQFVKRLWKSIHTENVQPLLSSTIVLDEPLVAPKHDAIAVVGMSCRYPGADTLEEFWNILFNGKDATGNPPEFRWLREQCSKNTKPGYRKTNAGFLKCRVDDFDAKFFGVSPFEIVSMDPQQRLLHKLVWEGLEDAAIDPHSLEGSNGGVFIGSWTNDYKDMMTHIGAEDYYRRYMGNSIGAGAARISHMLGLTGPAIATESGCSAAMVAVHLACKSLERLETNLALACGVNLIIFPFDQEVMPMVLAPDGHCKTFDAKADGFARAEGVGVLVLKRVSDAIRDGDNIWGLIRGSGMSQEGVSKSMGTPTVQCESMAMKKALEDANVEPAMVSYVEAHGTGTVVGDPMEIAAIAKAYHSKERKEPLLIGSVKTNLGHTESCSGIVGIMKVILAMKHEAIPPHINFETLNPAIDLSAVPARIPLELVNWPRQQGTPRIAGVSSFGITGTDAHVIIEEPPSLAKNALKSGQFERPLHIMKISAKTDEALDVLLGDYKSHLNTTNEELKDLAYTANIGRADFSQRAIIIAKSREAAAQNIETGKILRAEATPEALGKVCFLFTGQGSQYPGMGKQLYETSPVFRMHFEYCEKILKNSYNIDIAEVLWSATKTDQVSRTIYSQTSIFCVEYALCKLWESWGVKPDYVLGHSLGEFAAAVCANILSVEDALKLVAERSRLIDELPHGKMLVIKADKERVNALMKGFIDNNLNQHLDIAAINSAEQTVVAGDSKLIQSFSEVCKNSNLKCIVLEATHAFHSQHMDPMLDEYRKLAEKVKNLGGAAPKYISGMRGTIVEGDEVGAEYWVEHTREKVCFMDASRKAVELGCRTFIEVGPQPILTALTMLNNDSPLICLASLKKTENEWETLLNSLGKLYVKGGSINWAGFDEFLERKKVNLPHYPFIGKTFWPEAGQAADFVVLHPLLGSALVNPSPTKLFQSALNLRALEYVKDHVIGEKIIFPGAAFLEMCLAGGYAAVGGSTTAFSHPKGAIKLQELVIQAPLLLEESKTCQLTTMVEINMSPEEENDIKVTVLRKMDVHDSTKWLPHAKASYSPVPTAEEKSPSFDTTAFFKTLEQPPDENFSQEIYDQLATVGLKFGPTFKSLEKVWRDEEKGTLLAKVKLPPVEDQSQPQYIIHPVVVDAMIQAILMLRFRSHSDLKKKLYVPIKIGKFVWLSDPTPETTELYIHSWKTETSGDSALLLDSTGKTLATMSSVDLIETTVKAVESVLEQQTSPMPDLFEEVWKPSVGTLQYRADCLKYRVNISDLGITPDDSNTAAPHAAQVFREMERLVYFHMLRALYQRGWEPISGQTFGEAALAQQLGIVESYLQYFSFVLKVLESEGILEKGEAGNEPKPTWKIISQPLSLEETERILASQEFTTELTSKFSTTPLFIKVGEKLSEILGGKQPALPILFHDGATGCPTVADYYTSYDACFGLRNSIMPKFAAWVDHAQRLRKGEKYIMRVLETGGGTGAMSESILNMMEAEGMEFEYTFTDISPAFFAAAEKRFEKFAKKLKFKKFNIEEDPLAQGFSPEYFDIVLAADVIHATKDIRESLTNIRMLMRPFARLDIVEMTRVNSFTTFMFGLLDGFWRFRDYELRPSHCTLSQQDWRRVLNQSGFEVDALFPMLNDHHSYLWAVKTGAELERTQPQKKSPCWLIFQQDQGESSKISTALKERIKAVTSRSVLAIQAGMAFERICGESEPGFRIRKDTEEDYSLLFKCLQEEGVELEGILYCWALDSYPESAQQEDILRPYFYLTKNLLEAGLTKLPRLLTLTSGTVPAGDGDVTNFPLGAIWGFSKSLRHEYTHLSMKILDVEPAPWNEKQIEEIFQEMWNFDKEYMRAYREGVRFVPKLQAHKPTNSPLKLPPFTDRFQLILPESKSISDLQFGPLENSSGLEENEVEVQVKVAALNFRDVLSVLKPTEQFKDVNAVGFDFAGVVKRVGEKVTKWKVGDRVSGCNTENNALPSHVRLNQDLIILLPEFTTFCEAATIPAVYVTSLVCLIETAKIKKGEVVLLHTATGGVGLSAIEICKHVGCTIIATAGSKRKRNYLRSLGIQHIFHSRNTQYGDQILEVTDGRGVDVVLNSLTSDGFKEATLKACGKGARFIEMSKLNIWKPAEVQELRPDVEYTVVDVSSADKSEWFRLIGALRGFAEEGVVKPIPYAQFDGLHIREALQYMQKAKHIGKIVCVMPEVRNEGGEMKVYIPMFNERSSYLITGGLGGIGFAVCEWMVEKGAKHVILAGRSPPTLSIGNKIEELNAKGANVIAVQLDVGNFEECRELLQHRISELGMPSLKGVMHAAGILADGLIANQDWSKLSSVFSTKIAGTMHLHELTKHLNLEHFVVFSSIASLIGTPGQCNHAAANNFEDAFTHYRHSIGLPATSVNWGQWGEVGIATEVDFPGIKTISTLQGTTALEYALNSQRTQLTVLNAESFYVASKMLPHLAVYLDERLWKLNSSTSSVTVKSAEFWQKFDSLTEPEERGAFVKAQLKRILKQTLKLEEHEDINEDCDFEEMGVDSLMFVEIKNSLQALLGERVVVNASALKDCKTINLLTEALIEIIEGKDEEDTLAPPTLDEVNQLIREDCVLPDHIAPKPGQKATRLQDVMTILLAGCTGTLGPYILKELSKLPQISQIVCLIRHRKSEKGDERLRKVLETRGLLAQVDMTKVKVVCGNVALPKLGMSTELWEELSWSVDAVFNCSARVQHIGMYRKRSSKTDIRAVNIGGLKNLLEFACSEKLKYFCHASSLVAVATIDDEEGHLKECWPEIDDYDNVTRHAYSVSKFVGDYLSKVAVERGIPVKVFRFPVMLGEEETGRCELENNHALLRYIFILKSGCMQSTPFPVVALPVDSCAEAFVRLFFDDRAESELYNVGPSDPDMDQNFVHVAKLLGKDVEIVELAEFMKRVAEDMGEDSALKPFQEIYNDEDTVLASLRATPSLIQSMEGSDVFRSRKVAAVIPDFYEKQQSTMEYIYKDLCFLKEQGALKKFGL